MSQKTSFAQYTTAVAVFNRQKSNTVQFVRVLVTKNSTEPRAPKRVIVVEVTEDT